MPIKHMDTGGPSSYRPKTTYFGQESSDQVTGRRLVSSLNLDESERLKEYANLDEDGT